MELSKNFLKKQERKSEAILYQRVTTTLAAERVDTFKVSTTMKSKLILRRVLIFIIASNRTPNPAIRTYTVNPTMSRLSRTCILRILSSTTDLMSRTDSAQSIPTTPQICNLIILQ